MIATISPFEPEDFGVSALAQLAMQHSGAVGYALYALEPESGVLILQGNAGAALPQPQDLTMSQGVARRAGIVVISYPIRLESSLLGTLAFGFQGDAAPEERVAVLDRLARVIERVYSLPHTTARLFHKINRVEAELAASKITLRAQGLLGAAPVCETIERIDLIEQQVENMLRTWRLKQILEDFLKKTEEKLSKRKLTSQAKTLLQEAYGLSEEEAYHFLRISSRRTQRPVREIAQELIARNAGDVGEACQMS